jgi:hypothetical protein
VTDPISALFDELRRIHQRADEPSPEAIARLISQPSFSAGVVSDALFGPRLASWAKLNLIVKALGADAGYIHSLWRAAHSAYAAQARETASDEQPSDDPPNSSPPPVLDQAALQEWMRRYHPTAEEDSPGDVASPETTTERLARLDPFSAFKALAELPPAVAARRLAALTDEHARPIVAVMGIEILEWLITALPPSPQRERLSGLRPRHRSRPLPDTLAEAEKIQNLYPDLAKDWGWRK